MSRTQTSRASSRQSSEGYFAFQQTDNKEKDDDFMMRIMDGTCRGFFPEDQNCQSMLPACQARLEEQLDIFTHCRQPLSFLSFFQEHNKDGVMEGVEVLPAGMYVVPTFCEYCGSTHVRNCDPEHCQRPRLYFQKKRPPFCRPDPAKWHPITDHAVPDPVPPARDTPTPSQSSWVSGLFGNNNNNNAES